ncbi:hypothetical protein KSP40_PGU002502 [Platanthera guangdongensis]|uniref:Uncharacterized protein n=1 Tax=Platanthera guangdongensis TaxID=2320717 RepID=A0ABR2LZH3_9ASPA
MALLHAAVTEKTSTRNCLRRLQGDRLENLSERRGSRILQAPAPAAEEVVLLPATEPRRSRETLEQLYGEIAEPKLASVAFPSVEPFLLYVWGIRLTAEIRRKREMTEAKESFKIVAEEEPATWERRIRSDIDNFIPKPCELIHSSALRISSISSASLNDFMRMTY